MCSEPESPVLGVERQEVQSLRPGQGGSWCWLESHRVLLLLRRFQAAEGRARLGWHSALAPAASIGLRKCAHIFQEECA
jgi:hypothetical protein